MPKYAILYARFSPRSKSESCPSCEVQLADLERYCREKSYKIKRPPSGELGYHDDAVSGKSVANRPQFQAALKALKRGDTLLVRDFSRFSRSVWHTIDLAERLAKRGVRLESKEDGFFDPFDPNSFLANIFKAGFAQYQRMITGRRTSEKTRRYQYVDGKRMTAIGKEPYGWMTDPDDPTRTIPNPDEMPIREKIISLRELDLSYAAIAADLNELELRNRTGEQWSRDSVRCVIEGERKRQAALRSA